MDQHFAQIAMQQLERLEELDKPKELKDLWIDGAEYVKRSEVKKFFSLDLLLVEHQRSAQFFVGDN